MNMETERQWLDRMKKRYPYASDDTLLTYESLLNEGYSMYQAKIMAGLEDPPDD